MPSINRQIDAYKHQREPKFHQRQLIERIGRDFSDLHGKVLDIGCAGGAFLDYLLDRFPGWEATGFDISEELLDLARTRLGSRARLHIGDATTFRPDTRFDVVVASGVLSIFDDPFPVLDVWLQWLEPSGRLYVFGRFNSRPIDTRIWFRNHFKDGEWEGGLTSYSVHSVQAHLTAGGWSHEFERFHLPIDLPENEDPIRTFTIQSSSGERVVLNGANVVAEHYFLTIWREDDHG